MDGQRTQENPVPPADALPAGEPPASEWGPLGSPRRRLKRFASYVGTALIVALAPLTITVVIGILQTVRPDKLVSTRTPKDLGLTYEDVSLKTADGIDIAAWYVPAAMPTDAAVLVLHGYPADKGDILPRAAFLAKTYNLLLIDFRSFGRSGGAFTTMGPKEVGDAVAAVEYLKKKGAKRIGIYGFSMGGSVALMTPSRSDGVGAIVSEAAYADLWRVIEEPYRYLGPLRFPCGWFTALAAKVALGVDIDRDSPAAAVAGMKIPILLIHSRNDKVVPFVHAEMLQERLKGDPAAQFWFRDDGGHGEPSTDFPPKVQEFFDRNLTPSSP